MRENPTLGFRLSMESAGHSFSPSAPATRVYSLSLSNNEINLLKKKKITGSRDKAQRTFQIHWVPEDIGREVWGADCHRAMSFLSISWLPTHPTLTVKINKHNLHHQLSEPSTTESQLYFVLFIHHRPRYSFCGSPPSHLFSCLWGTLFCQLGGVCCLLEELLNFPPVYLMKAAARR